MAMEPRTQGSAVDAARFDLYAALQPYVRAYVARRLQPHLVDDVVAEVFATTWRHMEDVPESPLPWLYGVARNKVGNRDRTERRRQALQDKVETLRVVATSRPDIDVSSAERAQVDHALDAVSEADRELILLLEWEGLSMAQAAEVLDISKQAVGVRAYRARKRFRHQWEELNQEQTS